MLCAAAKKTTRTLLALGLVLACAFGSTSVRAQSVQVCVDDTYELTGPSGTDDVCPAAQLSSIQRHSSCDQDWMRVAVTAGTTYTFTTSTLQTSADTVIDLFQGCGQLVASNDNATSTTKASKVVWTATQNGTVDVRVTQASGTYGAGRGYDISVTATAATPTTTLLSDNFE